MPWMKPMSSRIALLSLPVAAAVLWACSDDDATGGGTFSLPDSGAITVPDSGETPRLDAGTVDVDVPACPVPFDATVEATISFTADNERLVWVNGVALDEQGANTTIGSPGTFPVTLYRNPARKNVIAIDGLNTSSQGGADRGILVDLALANAADGGKLHVLSDARWKISATGTGAWTTDAFDDSAWTAAVDQGPHGMSPWGIIPNIDAAARWIWLFDSSTDGPQKTDNQHAYARRSFYLDLQGNPVDAPVACP